MTPELGLSILATVLSVAAAIGVALLTLSEQRRQRRESAAETTRQTREPLSYAAGDLHSRTRRILLGDIARMSGLNRRSQAYVVTNTAFLFGQYLAWVELARQRVLLAGGPGRREEELRGPLDEVRKALADMDLGPEFMLHANEQRAIGELLLRSDSGGAEVRVMGYAAFVARFKKDKHFREWFDPITLGLQVALRGEKPPRLIHLQHTLLDLVDKIDPAYQYTPKAWREKWSS